MENESLGNTLSWSQNGHHFADDTLKCIFLNENVRILIKIPLKYDPKDPINNIPALVKMMAWHRAGDKPLYEPMMVWLPTNICVTRPLSKLVCLFIEINGQKLHSHYKVSFFTNYHQ